MHNAMRHVLTLAVSSLAVSAHLAQGPPPELDTRGLITRGEDAFDGLTMISPLTGTEVLLLDMDGEVVHRWATNSPTESGIFLESGNLLRWGITLEDNERFGGPGVDGGVVEELTWEGEVLWRYVLDDDYQLLHHDIALLPDGNILFLAWEHRYQEDAIAWGRDPAQVGSRGMWPDAVLEIKPPRAKGVTEAEVVWEWHAWDHIVQDFDESMSNYGSVPDEPGKVDMNADHRSRPPMTPEEIEEEEELERQMAALGYGGDVEETQAPRLTGTAPDWLHTNAIDYLAEHDLIVLSVPNFNELWVLDHSTTTEEAATESGGRFGHGGEILWRWGDPRRYGAGEEEEQQLSFQHDPTWLPSRAGELRLLVFNNGRVRPDGPFSSVDELVLPFDPVKGFLRTEGAAFGPAAPAWRYSEPGVFYSSFISGAQRLPNGNTLICSGAQGRVFEVTPDHRIVWDYRNPHTGRPVGGLPPNGLYRARRIRKDHPGLAGRL